MKPKSRAAIASSSPDEKGFRAYANGRLQFIKRESNLRGASLMLASPDVLSVVRARLEIAGFAIEENVALNGEAERTVQLLASRRKFLWKGMVLLSQTVVVRHVHFIRPDEVHAMSDAAFLEAKKRNTLFLPRGFQFGYFVVPCLVVEQVSPELLQLVASQPRKQFALFEFPIVFDLATGNSHYFSATPLWGAFYFSDLRAIAETIFPGARAQPSGPPIASPGPN